MKKIMLSLFALMATLSMSAQAIKIYGQNGDLVGVYKNGSTTQYKAVMTKDASGTIDGHEFVDLGLPSGTLWAKTNVGADAETDYGLYFAWGETTGYTSESHSFSFANYSLCDGSYTTINKYCTSSNYGIVDGITVLESADDAATVNWGSNWQMPSKAQQDELRTSCTWILDSANKGYKVTGPNGNSIILAAGFCLSNCIFSAGSSGYYWGRSLKSSDSRSAYYLVFTSSYFNCYNGLRYSGQSVRAVLVQK